MILVVYAGPFRAICALSAKQNTRPERLVLVGFGPLPCSMLLQVFQSQPIAQCGQHAFHFVRAQRAKPALELDRRNSLDLLQVERARFEKWFWDIQFPTVAAQSRGMKQNRDYVEFVIRRRAGQKRRGPDLGCHPKIRYPDFTGNSDKEPAKLHRCPVAEVIWLDLWATFQFK